MAEAFKVQVLGNKRVQKKLTDMVKRARNPVKAMAQSSLLMRTDIDRHFRDEKGPRSKWKRLKPSTLAARRKKGGGARILQDTGDLRQRNQPKHSRFQAMVINKLPYANIHNKGGMAGRNRSVRIPKRQFGWLSKSMGKRIFNNLAKFVTEGR